jgi:hypothetical protein
LAELGPKVNAQVDFTISPQTGGIIFIPANNVYSMKKAEHGI